MPLDGVASAIELRMQCEQTLALNTSTAALPYVFSAEQAQMEQRLLAGQVALGDAEVAPLFPGCDVDAMWPYRLSVVPPLFSLLTILAFTSKVFLNNTNPTALAEQLTDLRVMIIMLQASPRPAHELLGSLGSILVLPLSAHRLPLHAHTVTSHTSSLALNALVVHSSPLHLRRGSSPAISTAASPLPPRSQAVARAGLVATNMTVT